MKDRLITLGIGLAVFIALLAVVFFIVTTHIAYWLFLGIGITVVSYLLGWIVRDMWRMKVNDDHS